MTDLYGKIQALELKTRLAQTEFLRKNGWEEVPNGNWVQKKLFEEFFPNDGVSLSKRDAVVVALYEKSIEKARRLKKDAIKDTYNRNFPAIPYHPEDIRRAKKRKSILISIF